MRSWRGARCAPQYPLISHPLAVVLANRARRGAKVRVADVGALGPLPGVAVELHECCAGAAGRSRVERLRFDEGPVDWLSMRRHLPLELRGKPASSPARVRVRLVEADVYQGFGERRAVEPPWAAERELGPAVVGIALPVQRCFPVAILRGGQTRRQPELRAPVAAVLDEGEILTVGDEARGEPIRLEEDAVPRTLVVEGESVARVSDGPYTFSEVAPLDRLRLRVSMRVGLRGRASIGGTQRVRPEHVLDVSEEQLLML